jgi:hypothetical protein
MLRRRLVFVLGAGASWPYKFPLGLELAAELCGIKPDSNLCKVLTNLGGVETDHALGFTSEFMRSGLNSIDAFLSRRSEYERVGKLAIAAVLGSRESPDSVLAITNDRKDHWYRLLWNNLTAETGGDPAALPLKNVQIITFNYDRSLELFFQEAVKATFGVSDNEASHILEHLAILHVYGELGSFSSSGAPAGSRQYKPISTADSLRIAAEGIRVIPEARDDDPCFRQAQAWLRQAFQICFLGFGFDTLNMRRLGLANGLPTLFGRKTNLPRVLASVYGKTVAEIEVLKNTIAKCEMPEYLDLPNSLALRSSHGFQRIWADD